MRLLIITLTTIFISFGASANPTYYNCEGVNWTLKVEDNNFVERRKLYKWYNKEWLRICTYKTKITKNSFICYYMPDEEYIAVIFDETESDLTFYKINNVTERYNCNKITPPKEKQ